MSTHGGKRPPRRTNEGQTLVYAELVAAGGSIPDDHDVWSAVGRRAGYSGHRDLAGFYGGRYPSMRRRGGRRELTEHGRARAARLGLRGR